MAALAALLALAAGALALALALRPPSLAVPPQGLVLHHVTVVNPGELPLADRTVVIEGGRITRIGATEGQVPREGYAGSVVVPGLIDLHVHHPPPLAWGERELFALLFLAHGVTAVRDMGGAWPRRLTAHGRAIREGRRAGPRIFTCGPFLDGPDPDWPGARVVRDAEEGRRAARALAEQGYHCAKLYNGLSPEAVAGILEGAREASLPVVGHVPWVVPLDLLEHVEVHHLMGLPSEWEAARPSDRERYVRTARARRQRHVPTLVTFARASQIGEEGGGHDDPVGRLLPRYHRELLWNADRNPLARLQAAPPARVAAMKEAVGRLHAAGVPILAGTDTMNPFVVPGLAMHEELGHLADAGLTLDEAWAAATGRAGETLPLAGLGRVAEGAPADLLVLERDPTRDLAALSTLRLVVAAGRPYSREALEEALERARAHFEGRLYEGLSLRLARAGLAWLSWGEDDPPRREDVRSAEHPTPPRAPARR
jgi:hypothetical protein